MWRIQRTVPVQQHFDAFSNNCHRCFVLTLLRSFAKPSTRQQLIYELRDVCKAFCDGGLRRDCCEEHCRGGVEERRVVVFISCLRPADENTKIRRQDPHSALPTSSTCFGTWPRALDKGAFRKISSSQRDYKGYCLMSPVFEHWRRPSERHSAWPEAADWMDDQTKRNACDRTCRSILSNSPHIRNLRNFGRNQSLSSETERVQGGGASDLRPGRTSDPRWT